MSEETKTPPFHWTQDHARAWRLVASVWEHDGELFDTVVTETMSDGLEAVDRLLAALARNLVVRLRMEIGNEAFDKLIEVELKGCDTETQQGRGTDGD